MVGDIAFTKDQYDAFIGEQRLVNNNDLKWENRELQFTFAKGIQETFKKEVRDAVSTFNNVFDGCVEIKYKHIIIKSHLPMLTTTYFHSLS